MILTLFVAVAFAAAVEWENPDVNAINRLPPRTYSVPLASEEEALTDALEPETPYRKSLNGLWKIKWVGQPSLRPQGFERADFDDSGWDTIDVPSCVEMRGFGVPHYTNIPYPHANLQPLIRDRLATNLVFNPVSSYRMTFTVPPEWKDRRTILRFDGVYSAFYVWVNGKRVGYSEDSCLPAEFDITPYLKEGRGGSSRSTVDENLLVVEVYKWCDGSYLEDQDMFRFSGIFRDVSLWSMPKDGVWDFKVSTMPVDGYESWNLELGLENGYSATLYDAEKKKVGDLVPLSNSNFKLQLKPHLWSSEKPYLYTLVVRKGSDIRMKRVGFKEVKVVGSTILVNGRKIKFKGVNRHETDPDDGKTVSLATMRRDVELMKKYNFNMVRTAHYPDHRLWYDLCDREGLYVIAEANVEAHEPHYKENGLGRKPMWRKAIIERNFNHVTVLRNHPSVTIWSPGNETGHGDNFREALAEARKLDASRPFVWERGNVDVEIDSAMYMTPEWLEKRGRLGEATSGTLPDRYETAEGLHKAGKPFLHIEYAHAMGNAMGHFAEYWEMFYKYDALSGGCVWDWVDQSLWKTTDRLGPDGKPVRYLAYGGDYDESPNLGNFCVNGIVGSDRQVTAKLIEAGHVQRDLILHDDFTLENRFGFTSADAFSCDWELLKDGDVADRGTLAVPPVAPLTTGRLPRPGLKTDEDAEYVLHVNFRDASGWAVSRNEIVLKEKPLSLPRRTPGARGAWRRTDEGLVVKVGTTEATFGDRSGTLSRLVMNGTVVLSDTAAAVAGPRLTCARAFTDNDMWLRGSEPYLGWGTELIDYGFFPSGLSQLFYHARPLQVEEADGEIVVTTAVTVNGSKSAGFEHVARYRFRPDGRLVIDNETTPFGEMPEQLPRFGLSLRLDKALERMSWYGRGPGENYVDRKTSAFLGRYASTVSDQFVPYARPQDCGYKSDVRWIAFAAADGRGVRFSAVGVPLFAQALHYTWEDLEFSRHRATQLRSAGFPVPRPEVCLNLDLRQCGLGNGSCGRNPPLDKYRFKAVPERWAVVVEPVDTTLSR